MSTSRLQLVVCDGDAAELRLLRRAAELLEHLDVQVRSATGTDAARELLVDGLADALLLGGPGGEDGARDVERLRATGFEGPLVHVARDGVAGDGDPEALLRAGASEVLPRAEFSETTLARALDAALRIEALRSLVRRYRKNLVSANRAVLRLERETETARDELAQAFATPLETALEFLGRVLARGGGAGPDVQAEYLELAHDSLEQMAATLGRLTETRWDPDLGPTASQSVCRLTEVLRAAVSTRRRTAATAGVELWLDLAPGALATGVDEARIAEAVGLLLDDVLRGARPGTRIDVLAGPVPARPEVLELRIETEDRAVPSDAVLERCRALVTPGELTTHPRPGSGRSVCWVLPAERASHVA